MSLFIVLKVETCSQSRGGEVPRGGPAWAACKKAARERCATLPGRFYLGSAISMTDAAAPELSEAQVAWLVALPEGIAAAAVQEKVQSLLAMPPAQQNAYMKQ